ncbi:DUF2510 domain-containing protein [Demequina gelatinilytica]|uniref:DUF2510 domain-containing protein n=1 Tax=Demequina gelatinilytica TaxID=1638980 RepID=UPI0007861968|nr:DUF2510 domain-containing protein [Demequina gelatinilytica]
MTTENTTSPAAGWYPDPSDASRRRWWDGAAWTEQVAPAEAEPFATPGTDPFAQPEPARRNLGKIIGSAVAALVVGYLVYSGVVAAIEGATGSGDAGAATGSEGGQTLEAPVSTTWTAMPILDGGGSVAYDPSWQDISDVIGADLIESQAADQMGGELFVDGAWLVSGDLVNGGVSAVAISVPDVGGPSSARLEALAFVSNATAGVEDVEITAQRAVTTTRGLGGYIIEFGFPMYGLQIQNTVGVIVDGRSQVLIYTNGSDTLGSGVDTLESLLNSVEVG